MSTNDDIAVGPEDEASGIQGDPIADSFGKQEDAHRPKDPQDHEDPIFADIPSNASRQPELVPQSQNPNDPTQTDENRTVNIVALIVDNYGFSGPVAYEMCRFGTVKIDDVEWTRKDSFDVPYDDITGREIVVFEPGGKGVKFTYGG